MKELNLYIIEKLKINQDMRPSSIIERYQVGDICFLFWFLIGTEPKSDKVILSFNPILLTDIWIKDNKININFKNLYRDGTPEKMTREWKDEENKIDYIIDDFGDDGFGNECFGLITPKEECKRILDKIEKEECSLNIFEYIDYFPSNLNKKYNDSYPLLYTPRDANYDPNKENEGWLVYSDIKNIRKLINEKSK